MPLYPTSEQVMARPWPKHKPEVIRYMKEWKRTEWRAARRSGYPANKFSAIEMMLLKIAEMYEKPLRGVEFRGNELGSSYYRPGTREIFIIGEPSIVTALHELGHHLFGRSELKACRWSAHLFRKVFPRAFAALEFDGHMLRRARPTATLTPGPRLLSTMFPIGSR